MLDVIAWTLLVVVAAAAAVLLGAFVWIEREFFAFLAVICLPVLPVMWALYEIGAFS